MTTLASSGEHPATGTGEVSRSTRGDTELVQAKDRDRVGSGAWTHFVRSRHTADDRCAPHSETSSVSRRGGRSAGRITGRTLPSASRARRSAR